MKYKSGRLGKHGPLDKPEVESGALEEKASLLTRAESIYQYIDAY
jgi:hypothetical protein